MIVASYRLPSLTPTPTPYNLTISAKDQFNSPIQGVQVTIDGVAYITDMNGHVIKEVSSGSHIIGIQSAYSPSIGIRYLFTQWDDGVTLNPRTITISGPATYTAQTKKQYYLTMGASPSSGGSVSPSSNWYDAGATIAISASAYSDYVFERWEGSGVGSYSGTNNPASITINSTIYETAYFLPAASASILSHSSYMSYGYFHVVGEVKNTGSVNLEFVKITATFYDSANNVIATSFTYTMIDILLPNQKSPFELSTFPYSGPVDHYSLSISYYGTSSIPYRDLQVQGVTTSTIYGYYHVLGEVKNIGSSPTTFTEVIITFYDADGKVIGATFTFTDPYDLSPGQTAPFDASSYPLEIQPASYEIQVQAQWA